MQISVTFRHMDASDSVRAYIEEKLARIKKYLDEPIDAQAVVGVAKKIRHRVEVTLQAKGITIKGSDETNDMYAAVDAVVDKIERQVKRYKEKIKRHKPMSGRERQVQKTILAPESFEEGQEGPVIIRQASFSIKPMSIDEAVMQMDLLHKDFLVFSDDRSEEISVIYRRSDGNYGLIVPQAK
ncbi:MAG: ribosome-associated translation inhibitor RaiA [Deltaproteobacteria bacterium]|nr:ribosome-associated translation inhibitor RaiA [Deltaproteobacteria bacterium]